MGPAEPIRLALTLGGVAFEDNRVAFPDWKETVKATTKYGQLPVLSVDGKDLYQSTAIANYAAKAAGLFPSDPFRAGQVDEIISFVNQDIKDRGISKSMASGLTDEAKAELRKELNDTILPGKLAMLESMISDSGYFFETVTMADLTVYTFLNWIGMGVLDGISNEIVLACPKLKNLIVLLNENEKIKAWNTAKNEKLPWF